MPTLRNMKRQQSSTEDIQQTDDSSNESLVEENQNISIEMIYHQLKSYRQELLEKIENSKIDIVTLVQKENNYLREQIETMKQELSDKNIVISKLSKELDTVKADLEEKVDNKDFVEVERDVANLQQYSRRNNVEFCGIPDSVDNTILEQTIINIAHNIDIDINHSDFEACHRLEGKNKNGPSRVIARFANRRICESLLVSAKRLKSKQKELNELGLENSIYINNNLCNYYKLLWGKAKGLFKKKLIKEFWTSITGFVKIKTNDDKILKISHIKDLEVLFPNDI